MGDYKNFLIAIDSFKGSLSSLQAGEAAKAGVLAANPDADVTVKALADGGEGTYKTLLDALGGNEVQIVVKNPLGDETVASYGLLDDGTAVIEMAQASGLALVSVEERNPVKSNTYGFGQMIMDAYSRGARDFIIGIGGSATTEMGIGMLAALGLKFLDAEGKEVEPLLQNLDFIDTIDDSNLNKDIFDIRIQLACDVTNPLNGKNGAVAVFGPQKGVREDQIELFDKKLLAFAKVVAQYTNTDNANMPGAGAAGGLGFTIASFFKNTTVKSGADLIIEKLDIEEAIKKADVVITGEGRIDNQTASGKGPGRIAQLGKQYGCFVVGFSGILNMPYEKCLEIMDDIKQIKPENMPKDEAKKVENAIQNMRNAVKQFFTINM